MKPGNEGVILGILSLLISVVTLVVIVKGRNNALRENLYNRQLDIFQNLYSKIIDLEVLFHTWIPLVEKFNDDNQSEKEFKKVDLELEILEDRIDGILDKLDEEFAKAQILVPNEIAEAFDKFMETYDNIENKYYDDTLTKIELRTFSSEVLKLEDAIRDFIGLEKLSKENRSLI